MATRTAYAPVAASVLTAANLAKLPGGWIGDVQVTAAQTGIGSSLTDLTSASLAVTVGTGRRLKIWVCLSTQQVTTGGVQILTIMEGATQLHRAVATVSAGNFTPYHLAVTATPSSGAHTYKVQLSTSAGTVSTDASATSPVQFVVEDLGSTP